MVNPHVYHVDLSEKLWVLKQQLLSEAEWKFNDWSLIKKNGNNDENKNS
jgi:hypothetical protein